ncbi:MAG: D-glycerate dehydrogenase [Paracoccaceae bacterium]|nr:D-glycerate dehydrogenase [Paracoccaceae bacterium]
MKTLFVSRKLPDAVLEAAGARFEMTMRDDTAPMTEDEVAEVLGGFDAVLPTLGDACSARAIEKAGTIRAGILANFGVGYNHIDVAAARAAGLEVTNTPGAVTDATADTAMTLILMTCRRAGEGERLVRSGAWEGWHPTQLLGMHLGAKTLGIVGMGRIGKAIAKRAALGFGMKVVFFNRSAVAEPGVAAEQLGSIEEVAVASDVLVVAVPANAETHHLMNAEVFAAMKPGAYFINIARGDVMDEAALIAALQAGEIAGAGLDVYEFEPKVPAALIAMENVTLLPHLGTAALEVREGMGLMAVDNLIAWDEGRVVPNPV